MRFLEKASLYCGDRSARRQRDPVAGVVLEAAVQLELEQRPLHLGRARLALPDQLVDQDGQYDCADTEPTGVP
jgi:hypothetical protein